MDWRNLQKSIEKKEFSGVCLLHGHDEYLKDISIKSAIAQYVQSGLEDINISKIVTADFDKIKEAIDSLPFMVDKRIVIVDSFKYFYSPKNQYKSQDMEKALKLHKNIIENEYKECCIFMLCRGKVDSTNPLYKLYKKNNLSISYNNITEKDKADIIVKIAKESDMNISNSTAMFLIRYTGGDLLSIKNEMDKLKSYSKGEVSIADIEKVCHASVDYNVFAMIKAIDQKRKSEALKIFRDMLKSGEYLGGIVSLIERQYRVFAFIDDIEKEYGTRVDYDELEKRLGVKNFVIEKMYRQGKHMDKSDRTAIIKRCADADYLVKKGKLNDKAAVESLIINLMA